MGIAIWVFVYLFIGTIIAGLLYRFIFDEDFIEWNRVIMIVIFYPILLPYYLIKFAFITFFRFISGF